MKENSKIEPLSEIFYEEKIENIKTRLYANNEFFSRKKECA